MLHRLRTIFGLGSRRDPLGPRGERAAETHLRRRGYRVLQRNVHTSIGEADLVCLAPDKRTIVVVEVKTKRTEPNAPGDRPAPPPEASVTARKKQKLLRITEQIARREKWEDRPLRIDVVAIEWPDTGQPDIRHFENAVIR